MDIQVYPSKIIGISWVKLRTWLQMKRSAKLIRFSQAKEETHHQPLYIYITVHGLVFSRIQVGRIPASISTNVWGCKCFTALHFCGSPAAGNSQRRGAAPFQPARVTMQQLVLVGGILQRIFLKISRGYCPRNHGLLSNYKGFQ